jgi:hypothetical protein
MIVTRSKSNNPNRTLKLWHLSGSDLKNWGWKVGFLPVILWSPNLINPSPHFMPKHFGMKSKSAVVFERGGRGGRAATSQSRPDMLNKLAKCQTECASSWRSNIAVKAVHVTPAQRHKNATSPVSGTVKNVTALGQSLDFGPRNFAR